MCVHLFSSWKTVYSMAPFPFPQLAELREKYTYNITPFPAPVRANSRYKTTLTAHSTDGSRESLAAINTLLWDCRVMFYGTCVYIGMQILKANVLPYLDKIYTQFKDNFWLYFLKKRALMK